MFNNNSTIIMKNIIKFLSLVLLLPFVLHSCNNEDYRDWTKAEPSFKLYDTSLGSNVLYSTMENNPFRLTWDNLDAASSYDIVFSNSSDFTIKVKLGTSNKNTYTTTIGALNTALLQAGYSPYSIKKVYFRIEAGSNVSLPIAFDVQPYPVDVPVITAPTAGSVITLDANNPTGIAKTITWNDYSYGIDVKYLVEVSLSGANKFKELGTVNNLKLINVTNFDLDKLLLSVGGTIGVQGNFDIRVSAITKLVDPEIKKPSAIVTFKATPYQLSSFIYAPGGYQGWNPGTANTLVSATSNGTYFGFINFPAAGTEFKYTQNRNWDVNWGDNGADGTLELNGSNILSPSAGYYKVTVDTNSLTHSMVPYSVGLVGGFNSWGGSPDAQMEWDDSILKFKIVVTLPAGEFKFRVNSDWGENYGDDGADGTLNAGGSNLNITSAGTYTITFDPFNMVYTIN